MEGNLFLPLVVFLPMICAPIGFAIGRKNKNARNYFSMAVTAAAFALVVFSAITQQGSSFLWRDFGGLGLHLTLDGFRGIYASIAAFMWVMTTLFSEGYFAHYHNRNRYYFFLMLTFGATMGVFLSADFITTFLFFEVMSLTSYAMVAHDETAGAMRAAATYLAVAVIGGLVMLMGLVMLYHRFGTLEISALFEATSSLADKSSLYLPCALLMVGFGAKAGMFPLHIWLPKAHPVAPAPASALLSGILTKTGVYGVLLVSSTFFLHDLTWGTAIMIPGVVTMLLGAVLALFSVDLKRTLACSSVSQIGFILVGVGMQGILGEHNALAVRGTLLHMVNHSLVKLVLFMSAGVIYQNTHKLNLNDIRGYGRGKPILGFAFLMGALTLGGIPLWSGYISKTLLHESIVEGVHFFHGLPAETALQLAEYIFLFTGGITIAYMTKLFVAIFIEKGENPFEKEGYMNKKAAFALTLSAVLLPIFGSVTAIMDKIADIGQDFMHGHDPAHAVHYFAWINLKGAVISLAVAVVLYFGVVRTLLMKKDKNGRKIYVDRWPGFFDLENMVYRPTLTITATVLGLISGFVAAVPDKLSHFAVNYVGVFIARLTSTLPEMLVGIFTTPFRRTQGEKSAYTITSLSFNLTLLGIGLSIILVYMLFMAFNH